MDQVLLQETGLVGGPEPDVANMTPRNKRGKKARLLAAMGAICQICGQARAPEELTFDHIIPKAEGGSNSIENLRLACYKCNYERHH